MASRIAHDGILTRVGMPQVTEHKTTVEQTFNKAELLASIRGLSRRWVIRLPVRFCRSRV